MKGELYEYNGEKLTLRAIALRENLTRDSLAKNLEKAGDIYEAVNISKANQRVFYGTIEYKGKIHSIRSISKLEKLAETSLMRYYKECGEDIYKAVAKAKEAQEKRHGTILYNGQYMSLVMIAEQEDISITSLSNYYNECGDIYEAVRIAKEKKFRKHGSILYKGKPMTMTAIAKEEGLIDGALAKHYKKLGDIYKAVEKAKRCKEISHGTIEYNGKLMSIRAISKLENIDEQSLRVNYEQTGNIYDAVRIIKRKKPVYKGKKMSIAEIALLEGLDSHTLKKYYDLYDNIDKAVQVLKASSLKHKSATLKGKEVSYDALSKYFGISPIEIERLVLSGQLERKVDSISRSPGLKKDKLMYDEDNTLYKYCLEHSYNYRVIIDLVRRYHKTPEEAIKGYLENGQQIPSSWIYEKYGLLFKHVTLNFGLDSDVIVKIIKQDGCSITEAITRHVLRFNNKKYGFEKLEIDWLEELYFFISNIDKSEYQEIKKTFFITDQEEKFLNDKMNTIKNIERHILLYEFAEVIDEWTDEELKEMISLYELSDQEIEYMIVDLYSPFSNKVLDPRSTVKERKQVIRDIITNQFITSEMVQNDNNLSSEEKNEIIKKKELINRFITPIGQNKDRGSKEE